MEPARPGPVFFKAKLERKLSLLGILHPGKENGARFRERRSKYSAQDENYFFLGSFGSFFVGVFLAEDSPGRYSSCGGGEGLLEADHVFAGRRRVERVGFALDLFFGVVGGLDGEADAALGLVDLDDAGFDFLADLEDVLDLLDAVFADLRDVDQAVDVVRPAATKAPKLATLVTLPLTRSPIL